MDGENRNRERHSKRRGLDERSIAEVRQISREIEAKQRSVKFLNWEALFGALMTFFGWSILVSLIVPVIFLILQLTTPMSLNQIVLRAVLVCIGCLISFVPTYKATEDLIMHLNGHYRRHCLILGIAISLISLTIQLLLFSDELHISNLMNVSTIVPVCLLTLQFSKNKYQGKLVSDRRKTN